MSDLCDQLESVRRLTAIHGSYDRAQSLTVTLNTFHVCIRSP